MSMTFLNQLSVIPALFIALACTLTLRSEKAEKANSRLLLFSLGLGGLLLFALLVTARFIDEPYNRASFQLTNLLTSSLVGLTALILLNLREFKNMSRHAKSFALIFGVIMGALYSLLWNNQFGIGFLFLPGALVLAIGWALGKRFKSLYAILGLLSLILLFLFNWFMSHPPNYTDNPIPRVLGILFAIGFYIIPGLSVVLAASLITTCMQSLHTGNEGGRNSRSRWMWLGKVGFAVILIVSLAYTIFWGSVWDQTSDGLFGAFASQLSAPIGIGAGMLMIIALRDRYRLAGILFIVAVPILLYQSFEAGWRVSYHEITERRAARIARALDRFQAREGYYPEALDALTPRDMLFIQQPVIFAGEKWCYEAGEDYYRLSAFYREFFSSPVSLHKYESAGTLPPGPSACEAQLAAMKEKYYSPMEDPSAVRPPVPTPLPEIEVEIPKTPIQPLLNGAVPLPGSWSPDNAYFVFGTQDDTLELHFLHGATGETCNVETKFSRMDGLNNKYAWLPNSRLLFLDSTGDIFIIQPCQAETEQLTDQFPERMTLITTYEPENGKILLQSEKTFWILDGNTMEVKAIPDVTPNPYEFHWDNATWLPGGEYLMISRLNGRKGSNAGATLFLIDANTGEVQNSFDLDSDFGQSAPWVEGLSQTEVLLHSQGELLVADFSANPVKLTNVLESIFDLDIEYPDEVSAAGSHVNTNGTGYYVAVRLNHPHNQGTYLYSSETGRVHIYNHEYHTLFLFPDGYLMVMNKLENVPTYTDEYDIVRVGEPDTIFPRLVITGHTPREYPTLNIKYLQGRSQLTVASAHGVSLVSLSNGKMEAYWTLIGNGYSPMLRPSPDGSALVALKDFGGLYYIPLP